MTRGTRYESQNKWHGRMDSIALTDLGDERRRILTAEVMRRGGSKTGDSTRTERRHGSGALRPVSGGQIPGLAQGDAQTHQEGQVHISTRNNQLAEAAKMGKNQKGPDSMTRGA